MSTGGSSYPHSPAASTPIGHCSPSITGKSDDAETPVLSYRRPVRARKPSRRIDLSPSAVKDEDGLSEDEREGMEQEDDHSVHAAEDESEGLAGSDGEEAEDEDDEEGDDEAEEVEAESSRHGSPVRRHGTSVKTCVYCGTWKTPLWRNGPPGPKVSWWHVRNG